MQPVPEVEELEALAIAANVPIGDALTKAGVAQTTYWRWREGRVDPKVGTLRKVREAINDLRQAAA